MREYLSFYIDGQWVEPSELKTLERHHDPADVERSVALARAAGFHRINVDLIYAIPGQTLASFERNVRRALDLNLPHYSAYNLTYEPNTPMAVKKRLGAVRAVDDSVELEMLHHTRARLTEAGMPPYEISNYASPGEECRHNLLYWTGGNYVGLGPSAASHVEGHRFRNRPHLGEWEQALAEDKLPITDYEVLAPLQRAGERVMLMLRLTRPIDFADFAARTGYDARVLFADPLTRFARAGLIARDEAGFALTERGVDLADALASEFLAACV